MILTSLLYGCEGWTLYRQRDLQKSGPPTTSNFQCQICHRMCRSHIGLTAHVKSHSRWWDPSHRRLSPYNHQPVRSDVTNNHQSNLHCVKCLNFVSFTFKQRKWPEWSCHSKLKRHMILLGEYQFEWHSWNWPYIAIWQNRKTTIQTRLQNKLAAIAKAARNSVKMLRKIKVPISAALRDFLDLPDATSPSTFVFTETFLYTAMIHTCATFSDFIKQLCSRDAETLP